MIQRPWNTERRTSLLGLTLVVLLLAITGCGESQKKAEEPVQTLKAADFPHLQEHLFELSIDKDPAQYAEANLLDYKDGKVWVKLELKSETEQLPSGYPITVHVRAGKYFEALVDVKDLRKLSQEPQIEFISPLQKPQP